MKKLVITFTTLVLAALLLPSCAPEETVPDETEAALEGVTVTAVEIGQSLMYSPRCMNDTLFISLEHKFRDDLENQYISSYDLVTSEKKRLLEFDPASSRIDPPAVDDSCIVWTEADISGRELGSIDWRTFNRDIYLYDMDTGETRRITDDEYVQAGAVISGRWIVWLDSRHGTGELFPYPALLDVYAYDRETGEEKRITAAATAEGYGHLAISGDYLVWSDSRYADPEIQNRPSNIADYNNEIYLYNLSTGEERRISGYSGNDHRPAVQGSRIAWLRQLDYRKAEIVVYDLDTGTETVVSNSGYAAYTPSLYEDLVVWSDAGISEGNTCNDVVMNGVSGAAEIYRYDFSSGRETQLVPSLAGGRQILLDPVIHGDYIVYSHSRMIGPIIYMMKPDD